VKINYRPELDGIRAIAVAAVILHHSQIKIFNYQIFKGGFVGVDIFFVISGYLITSIILKELSETGSFSFINFYERRIRRILPPLLFVMLASLPFAWMYLLPNNFLDFSKSILYSLGFISNFYFYYTETQYGDENSLLKPFLHTWSLSVEEQYYIFFPIFLFILFKYFRENFIFFLLFSFITILLLSDWTSKNYPSFNFYILATRGWELFAGSILAYYQIFFNRCFKNKNLHLILSSLGLFFIFYSIFFFNDKMFHPSFYTLLPIMGVCLIIWFSQKDNLITKILSLKLFVGIGLISYSLYLWHYPIFAFARITEFTQGNSINKLLLALIIFLLSIFSYFFIEETARNKKNKFIYILFIIFFSYILIFIFLLLSIFKDGFPKRIPEILRNQELNNYRNIKQNGKDCHSKDKSFCIFYDQNIKNIFLLGDSHVDSILKSFIENNEIKKNYRVTHMSISGGVYLPNFQKIDKKTKKVVQLHYSENRKEVLNSFQNSIIIINYRMPLYLSGYYFNNQEGGADKKEEFEYYFHNKDNISFRDGFLESVNNLKKNNYIILVYPVPETGWNVSRKILLERNNKIQISHYITTSYKVYKDRTKSSFELLDSIKGKNVHRVYPHKIFCNTLVIDRCITHDEKNIFYADYDHLSYNGSLLVNKLIIEKIKKIEKESN
jgi:peptidoglycan/LPS O-acetylase OafA/YrhL